MDLMFNVIQGSKSQIAEVPFEELVDTNVIFLWLTLELKIMGAKLATKRLTSQVWPLNYSLSYCVNPDNFYIFSKHVKCVYYSMLSEQSRT